MDINVYHLSNIHMLESHDKKVWAIVRKKHVYLCVYIYIYYYNICIYIYTCQVVLRKGILDHTL